MLSTVSSDSHTWNLVFLQLALQEAGYSVLNLGPCVPDEVLLTTTRQERPDAIVISSVNGHGHLDGARVVSALRADPQVGHIPVLIGGKLGIQGRGNDAHVQDLLNVGCSAVFTDTADIEALPRALASLTQPDDRREAVA